MVVPDTALMEPLPSRDFGSLSLRGGDTWGLPTSLLQTQNVSPDDIGSSFLARCYQHEVNEATAVCLAFVPWAVAL